MLVFLACDLRRINRLLNQYEGVSLDLLIIENLGVRSWSWCKDQDLCGMGFWLFFKVILANSWNSVTSSPFSVLPHVK